MFSTKTYASLDLRGQRRSVSIDDRIDLFDEIEINFVARTFNSVSSPRNSRKLIFGQVLRKTKTDSASVLSRNRISSPQVMHGTIPHTTVSNDVVLWNGQDIVNKTSAFQNINSRASFHRYSVRRRGNRGRFVFGLSLHKKWHCLHPPDHGSRVVITPTGCLIFMARLSVYETVLPCLIWYNQ